MEKIPQHATVLILNWNGEGFLRKNLPSVCGQTYSDYSILIVDNGSTDNSVEYIKSLDDSRIKLLELEKNFGFARGNNKGIEKIIADGKSPYIVTLNNDIKVENDWLEKLLDGFSEDSIGITTSNIFLYYPYSKVTIKSSQEFLLTKLQFQDCNYHTLLFLNGFSERGENISFPVKIPKNKEMCFGVPYDKEKTSQILKIETSENITAAISIDGKTHDVNSNVSKLETAVNGKSVFQNAGTSFNQGIMLFTDNHIYEFEKTLESEDVAVGCGGAMAIRVDLLKKFGAFKDKYIMYWEDSELGYRFQKNGYKTRFVADARCYHVFWGTSGAKMTGRQIFFGTRNRLWFIREYFGLMTFSYYYCRTLARFFIWCIKAIYSSEGRMYAPKYFRALLSVLK